MRRCTRCILPETVNGISFDDRGVCNFCLGYREPECLGDEALAKIVESARGASDPYDCVVPLSGGRDSSYVLYLAKAVFDLRVLAVNYDNEFQTDQAGINIQRACERLGVPLHRACASGGLVRKIVSLNLRCSVPRKLFRVCRACTYGFKSAVFRAALRHRVPLIFWGDSKPEEVAGITVQASRGLKLPKSRPATLLRPTYWASKYYLLRQRLEFPVPGNSIWRQFPKLADEGIREVHVFDYVKWDRRTMKETIARHLGWAKPPGSASSWRTDCKLSRLVDHCFVRMHGCSKACFGYSKMINAGQMGRGEALAQEEAILAAIKDASEVRALLADEVGLPAATVERIMAS